jgi:hypothetical protein
VRGPDAAAAFHMAVTHNLAAHEAVGVARAIEAARYRPLHEAHNSRPNPIELILAKLKALLPKAA